MGELGYGVNVVNKFAFLDEDEDPSVALERAKKEKKEKVKQAKIDSKKGPATSAPIAQPTKPVKEPAKEKRTERRQNSGACHNCGGTGHFAKDCTQERKPREKPTNDRRPERKEKREGRQTEDGEKRERRAPQGNCYNCGNPGHLSRDCPEERKPRERPERRERAVEDGEKRERRAPVDCYNCGTAGHLSRDCPEERKQREKPPVQCYNCHQNGHISKDCPEARQAVDENTVPKSESKPVVNDGEQQDENAETTDEQKADEEKQLPQLTLAEWKAQQKQDTIVFNSRGADRTDKNLQNFEVLKRDGEKAAEGDDSYEYEEIEVQSKRAQNTRVLDIDVNFANANRGPAGRQQRDERRPATRGGNARAPAGASGSGRPSGSGRRLNLVQDFPALG